MAYPRVTAAMLKRRRSMFPELAAFKKDPRAFRRMPYARRLRAVLGPHLKGLYPIPHPHYSLYRDYWRSGNRRRYESVREMRADRFSCAVMAFLLDPQPQLLDAVQDYLWSYCESSTWILPAHEGGGIDLAATEMGFALAEVSEVLKDDLAPEVRERVRYEVRRRVVDPYIAGVGRKRWPAYDGQRPDLNRYIQRPDDQGQRWKFHYNNWNGVCNSSTGAAMLYVEDDVRRLAAGLNEVIRGLEVFMDLAFDSDGVSTEGIGYWQYGLCNFIAFSELLRHATGGKVDLLEHPKMHSVARYPLSVMLSLGRYFSYSDSSPELWLSPGVISKLAWRAGVGELNSLVRGKASTGGRMPMILRDWLWGPYPRRRRLKPVSTLMPVSGLFRLVSGPVVIAGKAGHNGECHNHNDVGSFVVHAWGEDLLVDPGRPMYSRDFFSDKRYDLFVQASSLGHSVPVIDGKAQSHGKQFRGQVVRFEPDGAEGAAELELAGAYPARTLRSLRRVLTLKGADLFELGDTFEFSGKGKGVCEAFVSWHPTTVEGQKARIRGGKSTLTLTITEPAKAKFRLEKVRLDNQPGRGQRTLYRIRAGLRARSEMAFRMTGRIRARRTRA